MNKTLIIKTPYIKSYGDKVRLQASIISDSLKKEYYFEVHQKWAKYLCVERSDAFVLGLLYFSMVNGYDIKCEAPISEKLYYQLKNVYIPTVTKQDPELFKNITILAELDSVPISNEGGVGASVSGGVDSFYTILKNCGMDSKHYNITHLLLTNCFNIYRDDNDTRNRFEEICKPAASIAAELEIEFIDIYTNENNFWYPHFVDLFCMRYCSLPYALQKLFSVYNYSTGYQYKDFTFKAPNRDASHYDFFSVHLISNENLTVYSSGGEASRAEKASYIADSEVVQRHLQVCNIQHTANCCACEKCLRTQLNLYACGKLDKFQAVFDLEKFDKNKNNAIQAMFERNGDFDKEIIEMMDKNQIIIPFTLKIKGITIRSLKKIIKSIKPVYKIIKKFYKKDNPLLESERYNTDYEYAKKCNPNIV